MTTFSELADLVELYAGRAGVVGDSIDRKLMAKMVSLQLKALFGTTLSSTAVYTLDTIADTTEYALPAGIVPDKIIVDEEVATKIAYNEALELRYSDE